MKGLVAWLGTPVGRFVRDLVEGAIAGRSLRLSRFSST